MAIFEVPMMGVEPIPRFSRERILSPLRLPFRHIGFCTLKQRFYLAKQAVSILIYSIIEKRHSHTKNTCKLAIDGNSIDP